MYKRRNHSILDDNLRRRTALLSQLHQLELALHALCLGIIFTYAAAEYTAKRSEIVNSQEGMQLKIASILQHTTNKALDRLWRLHETFHHTDSNEAEILALLVQSNYAQDGEVRHVWANDQGQITLSSRTQRIDYPVVVAERDYYRNSRDNPGKLQISGVIEHITLNTPILTYALGVTDHQGEYTGSFIATVDLLRLEEQLAPLLDACLCDIRIDAPGGGTWLSAGDVTRLASPHKPEATEFAITAKPSEAALQALKKEAIIQLIGLFILVNGSLWIMYRLVNALIIQPVGNTLQKLSPNPKRQRQLPLSRQLALIEKRYYQLQHTLAQQESVIRQCHQVIDQLQSQQQQYMQASSEEMHRAYERIVEYANHLEEMALHQELDPDAPYAFDDVREMGSNLQRLADCYSLFYASAAESKPEMVDPAAIIKASLQDIQFALERRNISPFFTARREIWTHVRGGKARMPALIQLLMFLAVRYGEDEAELHMMIDNDNNDVVLRFDISHFRQSTLPANEQDFSMFTTRLSRDMQNAITRKIDQHVNMVMGRALSGLMGGNITLKVAGHPPGFRITLTIATEPPLPAE